MAGKACLYPGSQYKVIQDSDEFDRIGKLQRNLDVTGFLDRSNRNKSKIKKIQDGSSE